jgi:hypothetical protein
MHDWMPQNQETCYCGDPYDKAREQKQITELQGICNRLMQENTELQEKVAGWVKLPSEDRLYDLLLEAKAEAAITLGVDNPETFHPLRGVAKALIKLLQGEKPYQVVK